MAKGAVNTVVIMAFISLVLLGIGFAIFYIRLAPQASYITLSGCWSRTVATGADIQFILEGPKVPFQEGETWGNKTVKLDETCVDRLVFTDDLRDYTAFTAICKKGETYLLGLPRYGKDAVDSKWYDVFGFEEKIAGIKDAVSMMRPFCFEFDKPIQVTGYQELQGGQTYCVTVTERSEEAESYGLKITREECK